LIQPQSHLKHTQKAFQNYNKEQCLLADDENYSGSSNHENILMHQTEK